MATLGLPSTLQDVRKSAALKDALAQHYYGQFSFTPDINPKSRVIGKVGHTLPPGQSTIMMASYQAHRPPSQPCTAPTSVCFLSP
jgi:hypothetical protein